MKRLENRVCLVTGSGRGIGKGIAERLLREGARVWICDLYPERVELAVDELSVIGEVAGGPADVSRRDQVEAMVQAVVNRWGRLDVLVNNAGYCCAVPFLEMSDEHWDKTLNINLRGTFLCSQAAARQMAAQGGGGALINISSTNGLRGQPTMADYGVSKAGIINLTKTLALELVSHRIRVNAVCPGSIRTAMTLESGMSEAEWETFIAHIPMRRMGKPSDIGAAVAYLASEDAEFVTGHVMVVDGGLMAQQ